MASVNDGNDLHVRVLSRRLVKASDSSIKPHVLAVSNLDLIQQTMQTSMFCIYPRPPTSDFSAVFEAIEAGIPSFLNHFFPFVGRIATNPSSGLPEFHCHNRRGARGRRHVESTESLKYVLSGSSSRMVKTWSNTIFKMYSLGILNTEPNESVIGGGITSGLPSTR
jgi:hypothetical protein